MLVEISPRPQSHKRYRLTIKIITVKVLDESQSQFDDIKEEAIPSARNMAAAVITNMEEKSRRRNEAAEKSCGLKSC